MIWPVLEAVSEIYWPLKIHTRSVHEKLRFICSVCGKVFTQKIHRDCHIRDVHDGKEPYDISNWDDTGKSFSEAFILTSTNPIFDKILFIDLPVHYMKTTSSEYVVYTIFFLFWHPEQFMYTTCSELLVFM